LLGESIVNKEHSKQRYSSDRNAGSTAVASLHLENRLQALGQEGYLILSIVVGGKKCIVISANSDIGLLYGTYHFIRLLQTNQQIAALSIESSPKIKIRILNHWDNLDRTVERGYAGFSLWDCTGFPT
jgi:alpha-glucuronidase